MSTNFQPGDDVDTAASIGVNFGIVSAAYRSGLKRHFSDSYSGTLAGNYNALAKNSSSSQMYHQLKMTFSTTNAYKRKSFPIPLMISFGANQPLAAKNSSDETYYEVSLASFLARRMRKRLMFAQPARRKSPGRNSPNQSLAQSARDCPEPQAKDLSRSTRDSLTKTSR